MEFQFESRRPGPPLTPFAEWIWFARGRMIHRRERIAPTGSTVAVLVLGPPIMQTPRNGAGALLVADRGWLAGPHEGPVVNEPTGETIAAGIVASPVGCRALFGIDPAPLRGRVVDLDAVWPPARRLRAALLSTDDAETCLDLVEEALRTGVRTDVRGWERCAAAVAAVEDDPLRPIAAVAADLAVSHAHLDREFTRVVGLTPRSLGRILRLRRLLEHVDIHHALSWKDLAADWGWFDQSHFIRDFKRHTGVTPSDYVVAQRAAAAVGQYGPGFVPDL